jgi:hypothetical protein
VNPNTADGSANAFLSVVQGYTIGGNVGLWESALNGNWFTTNDLGYNFGAVTGAADLRNRSNFNHTVAANNWNEGENIFGLASSDPARVYTAVPEPSFLILLGAGLIGLAYMRSRSQFA